MLTWNLRGLNVRTSLHFCSILSSKSALQQKCVSGTRQQCMVKSTSFLAYCFCSFSLLTFSWGKRCGSLSFSLQSGACLQCELPVHWAVFNTSFIEPWSSLTLSVACFAHYRGRMHWGSASYSSYASFSTAERRKMACLLLMSIRSLFVFSARMRSRVGSSWHGSALFERGVRFQGRHCLSPVQQILFWSFGYLDSCSETAVIGQSGTYWKLRETSSRAADVMWSLWPILSCYWPVF